MMARLLGPFRRVAVSVAVPLVVCLTTVAVMSIPPSRGQIDPAAGGVLFRAHCGGCHFTTPGFPNHPGPNLAEIGKTAASRRPHLSASEYLLESILEPSAFDAPSSRPGMPKNAVALLSPDEIRNVVAFLAGRGAFPDYKEIQKLDIPDRRSQQSPRKPVRLNQMKLAEQVMRDNGRCLDCHALHSRPEYEIAAPGIFGVGLIDRRRIKKSILDPCDEVAADYGCVNVYLSSGQVVSGRLLYRTEGRLYLLTQEEGRLEQREIALTDVEKEDGDLMIFESAISIMPTGFDQVLTAEEIDAVITLIRQLN